MGSPMTAWPLPRPWRRARFDRRPSHAMSVKSRISSEWTPWAYAIVAAALVVLLIEVVRGAVHELSVVRTQTLHEQLRQLQSQAMQRAKGLEVLLQSHHASDQPWEHNRDQPWFAAYWSGIDLSKQELYAAVVDSRGQIVAHSDPARIGRRLESGWYERKIS